MAEVTQASTTKFYQQCWKEWAGWYAEVAVPKNAISLPNLAEFCFICLGLDWLGAQLVFIILKFLSFFLEPHHHHRLQII